MNGEAKVGLLARILPGLLLLALGGLVLWRQGFYLVDDAYITFRYALNLAAGHGPVWNPGELVEGYTSVLWMLLLVPAALAGIDLVWPAAAASLLFALGTIELLQRIARAIWPEQRGLVLLACCLLATNPSFVYWSVMGMEAPAFAFWVLLASRLLIRGRREPRCRKLAGVVLALAILTRPEGGLVAAVLLMIEVLAARGTLLQRLGLLLPAASIVGVIAGAHLAFRLWYYGDLLPNTFYAKVIFGWITIGRGLEHLGLFLAKGGFLLLPALWAIRLPRPVLRPYLVHGCWLLAVYVIFVVIIGGDWPQWYRFYLPLLALPLLGTVELLGKLAEQLPRRSRMIAMPLVIAVPAAVAWPHAEAKTIPMIHIGGLKNTLLDQHFFGPQVPDDALVAAFAVGMLGYHNRFRVLDGWGLNNRHIARLAPYPNRRAPFGHEKSDLRYVLSQQPDYLWIPRTRPRPLKGYDVCWPSWMIHDVIYRRNTRLTSPQRSLGVPPGFQRDLRLPPPCQKPATLLKPSVRLNSR